MRWAADKALEKEYDLTEILEGTEYSSKTISEFSEITRHDLALQLYLMNNETKVFPKPILHTEQRTRALDDSRRISPSAACNSVIVGEGQAPTNTSFFDFQREFDKQEEVNPSDSHEVLNPHEPTEQQIFINQLRQSIEVVPLDTEEEEIP